MRCGSRSSAAKATSARELLQRTQQGGLRLVVEQLGCELRAVDAGCRGIAGDVVGARVRVLHVEDGVVVRLLLQHVEVDVEVRVGRAAHEGVARGIRPDDLDEVFERDDRARALGHAHGLAVLDEVDELPDEDLQVDARLVAERGASSPSCAGRSRGDRRRA